MKKITPLKFLLFLTGIIVFSACQKVVVLDLNTAEPQFVIEGNMTTKEGMPNTVFLSSSGSFYTGEGIAPIEGADVLIRDSKGNEAVFEMYAPGIYYSFDIAPVADEEYSIEVTYNGEQYSGNEVFPVKKTIDSLSYVVNTGLFGDGTNEDGDTTYNLILRFQDPVETFDFYRMEVSLNDSVIQAGFGTYLVTDDELFNGQLYDFEIFGTGAIKGDTVQVDFQSIGANTYKYYMGLNDALNSGGMGSTPYNPIGNLNNDALGYFGAYTSDVQTIIIE